MNEIRKHIFLGLFSFPAVGINQMSKAHQSAVLWHLNCQRKWMNEWSSK